MSKLHSLYPSIETLLISDVLIGKKSLNEVNTTFLQDMSSTSNINKMLTTISTPTPHNQITPYHDNSDCQNHSHIVSNNPMCFNMIHADGIREVILVRANSNMKFGFGLVSIDACIYVSYIEADSPTSKAKIRFGDQIIRINILETTGKYVRDIIKYIKSLGNIPLNILIRDRPLHKVYELYKNEDNRLGLGFKNGVITHLETNTSASKNGIPIRHKIVEINAMNVVGLSDMELINIFQESNIQIYIGVIKLRDYKELMTTINKKKMKTMEHTTMSF